MKKIYLSPSNQTGNKFIIGNTNEGTVWLDIAKRTAKILEDYDCEVKVSKASQTLAARAAEAQAWGADCYIAMHSNAAGTANKGARGVEVYYSPKKGPETRLLASSVLKELSHLFKNRGLKQSTNLIDCYKPAMPSIIGECGFHDNVEDATLILENKDKIAQLYVLTALGGQDDVEFLRRVGMVIQGTYALVVVGIEVHCKGVDLAAARHVGREVIIIDLALQIDLRTGHGLEQGLEQGRIAIAHGVGAHDAARYGREGSVGRLLTRSAPSRHAHGDGLADVRVLGAQSRVAPQNGCGHGQGLEGVVLGVDAHL